MNLRSPWEVAAVSNDCGMTSDHHGDFLQEQQGRTDLNTAPRCPRPPQSCSRSLGESSQDERDLCRQPDPPHSQVGGGWSSQGRFILTHTATFPEISLLAYC